MRTETAYNLQTEDMWFQSLPADSQLFNSINRHQSNEMILSDRF